MATAIQGFSFGGIRPFAAQITPLDFMGRYTGILVHLFLCELICGKTLKQQ
jgi:hypothetical protein